MGGNQQIAAWPSSEIAWNRRFDVELGFHSDSDPLVSNEGASPFRLAVEPGYFG